MTIYLPCPYCTNNIEYSRKNAGKTVQCGWCYKSMRLPHFHELTKEAAEELLWVEAQTIKKQEKQILKEKRKQDKIQREQDRLNQLNERHEKEQAVKKQNALIQYQLHNSPVEIEKQKLLAQQRIASNLLALKLMCAGLIFILFFLPSCLRML